MISYLDDLERDLTEAIDRRAAARPPRWRRRTRRLDWMRVAAAVPLIAIAIAIVAAVTHSGPDQDRAIAPPAVENHQPPAPIPPHTPLRLVGDLTRIDPTTWRGQARGPGGLGTLTLTGTINLTARPCCDTPRSKAADSSHRIRFTWTNPSGTVSGWIENTTYRRPHGRFVWDGGGRVTVATGALRRYRDRPVGIAGETRTATPDRARIIL